MKKIDKFLVNCMVILLTQHDHLIKGRSIMTNTGKQYEELAQMVFSHINNLDRKDVKTIGVQHNVNLQGKTTNHQIDVYWEFMVGIVTHKVVVQAKDLKSKVSKGDMSTFSCVIDDIPGVIGIFITTKGYQKGALEVARAHGIYVYELRTPEEGDWDGLLKIISINMYCIAPYCENFSITLDNEWLVNNNINKEKIVRSICVATCYAYIFQDFKEKRTVQSYISEICNDIGIGEKNREIKFEDETFIELPGEQKLKIKGFQGIFGNREYFSEMKIDGGNIIDVILKNVVSGETQMFNTLFIKKIP